MQSEALKIEFKWAWIISLMMLGWMFIEKSLGFHDEKVGIQPLFNLLSFFPFLLLFFFAMREKKKKYFDGRMKFSQAFRFGFTLTIFLTLLSPLVVWISHTMISPNYFQEAIHFRVESKLSTLADAENYYNLTNYIIQSILITPFFGLSSSLFSAFILSQSKR